MHTTPLRKLYRSLGKSVDEDKKSCKELLAGLNRSHETDLASLFHESLEMNAAFDGRKQSFLNAASLRARKPLGPHSRGDNRIAYLMATHTLIDVVGGPRGYTFRYINRQVPPFRQERSGKPHSGAGGVDYTAVAGTNPVLGEIKVQGDKTSLYAFIQLLTYLAEMATANQVQRASLHKEFGISLRYPQRFDLHILLVDQNPHSERRHLVPQTRDLVEAFLTNLKKRDPKVIGQVLCLQMDSKEFTAKEKPSIDCLWHV